MGLLDDLLQFEKLDFPGFQAFELYITIGRLELGQRA